MIADMMPGWLWRLLRMGSAILPTDRWTWRHFCRYGRSPFNLDRDMLRRVEKDRRRFSQ